MRRLIATVLLTLVFVPPSAAAEDWKPINPEDLALKTATVDKDAEAEALFWQVRIDDAQSDKTVLHHYLRTKIYTSKGAESQSRMDLTYVNGVKIGDIAARTIKPDGTIVELKKDAVFERTIIKAGKTRIRAKSFVMPGVEPGSIIEYQWREERASLGDYVRLEFQREIPVRSVTYYIKPFANTIYPMVFSVFNMASIPLRKEPNGFSSLTVTNVPAFKAEPFMPPESELRPWILLYYAPPNSQRPAQYWADFGKKLFEIDKADLKVNDDIRHAATTAIGSSKDPLEKLSKLYEFTRSKVVNPFDDASDYSPEDLAKVKQNGSPADTLKRGIGTGLDIDMLFGALAMAAGFEVRVARLSDRSDVFFKPAMANSYFLSTYDIAVKVGAEWRFFNPGNPYLPFGMLSWWEEGVPALIPDGKEPLWVTTSHSGAEKSRQARTARFRLQADGTLEGDVEIEHTGQFALEEKERHDALTPAEQREDIAELIKDRLSTAQITDVVVENAKDGLKPLIIRYHIRVPQYAQRTGRRLFFQPSFFEQGEPPAFSVASRNFPVYFPYGSEEEDEITIEVPEGFEVENPETPGAVRSGDLAHLEFSVGLNGRTVVYRRKFSFGGNRTLLFPATEYTNLKKLFDAFYDRDTFAVTVREASAQAK